MYKSAGKLLKQDPELTRSWRGLRPLSASLLPPTAMSLNLCYGAGEMVQL